MPRHIQARRQYDRHRYARHLSQQELDRRIRDVVLNNLTLTSEAKIGLLPIDGQGLIWMEKWIHVLEEMQLRYGPFPNGFTRNTHRASNPEFEKLLQNILVDGFDTGG